MISSMSDDKEKGLLNPYDSNVAAVKVHS